MFHSSSVFHIPGAWPPACFSEIEIAKAAKREQAALVQHFIDSSVVEGNPVDGASRQSARQLHEKLTNRYRELPTELKQNVIRHFIAGADYSQAIVASRIPEATEAMRNQALQRRDDARIADLEKKLEDLTSYVNGLGRGDVPYSAELKERMLDALKKEPSTDPIVIPLMEAMLNGLRLRNFPYDRFSFKQKQALMKEAFFHVKAAQGNKPLQERLLTPLGEFVRHHDLTARSWEPKLLPGFKKLLKTAAPDVADFNAFQSPRRSPRIHAAPMNLTWPELL